MKKRFFLLSAAFIFIIAVLYADSSPQQKLPHFYDSVPDKELALSIIKNMTDEELLAQAFMFGWTGQIPGDLIIKWVEESGLGSIKIFGWNTKDSRKLAEAVLTLQKKSGEGAFRYSVVCCNRSGRRMGKTRKRAYFRNAGEPCHRRFRAAAGCLLFRLLHFKGTWRLGDKFKFCSRLRPVHGSPFNNNRAAFLRRFS